MVPHSYSQCDICVEIGDGCWCHTVVINMTYVWKEKVGDGATQL